jgi:hypothetical protein
MISFSFEDIGLVARPQLYFEIYTGRRLKTIIGSSGVVSAVKRSGQLSLQALAVFFSYPRCAAAASVFLGRLVGPDGRSIGNVDMR